MFRLLSAKASMTESTIPRDMLCDRVCQCNGKYISKVNVLYAAKIHSASFPDDPDTRILEQIKRVEEVLKKWTKRDLH